MNKSVKGSIITVILTSSLMFLLFHNIILHPNDISFASGGDGIKSTFGTLYHIEHDTTYWHTGAMNYPYGESVFFTGNQVFLTNVLKFLKDRSLDPGAYALGISNMLILFSYVLCALFIFLIFNELNVPVLLGALFAVIITFLSPQWARLSGHFNLAYAYAFPAAIWLIMVFYRKPRFLLSVIIGLYLFFMCWKHLYFYVLIGLLLGCFWVYVFFTGKERFGGTWKMAVHFTIQLIIPIAIFILFSNMYDVVIDRTAYPWGFKWYSTRIEGVFLPLLHPYFPFIRITGSWRTLAYVGAFATLIFLYIIFRVIYLMSSRGRSRDAFLVSDHRALNILFWASVISFLISLGLPFTLGVEKWLNYTGPFRQFRAIGRFVFPFFYMLNIMAFYLVWKWMKEYNGWVMKLVFSLALIMTVYDAWLNIAPYPKMLDNKIPTLNDRQNILPEDQWVKKYDWSKYQAIMPFPYFHVGSENYWVGGDSPVQTDAYVASLKTGLPLNAVMLSRTSISQTLKNLDLCLEPYRNYPILDDLPSRKPFLFVYKKNTQITENEKRLIDHAQYLTGNKSLEFYRFYPDTLKALVREHQAYLKSLIPGSLCAGDESSVIYENFDEEPGDIYSNDITRKTKFFETEIPDTGTYEISFWFLDGDKDLYPRTRIDITLSAPGEEDYFFFGTDVQKKVVTRDSSRVLFEESVDARYPGTVIKLSYHNKVLTKGKFRIDDLLIRKKGQDVRFTKNGHTWINDREIFGD